MIREITAIWPPQKNATKSSPNSPISPQFSAPMSTKINAIRSKSLS